MNTDIIIYDLISTFFTFMIVPIIIKLTHRTGFEPKKAKLIALINSIVALFMYFVLFEICTGNLFGWNLFPGFLFYLINSQMLLNPDYEKSNYTKQQNINPTLLPGHLVDNSLEYTQSNLNNINTINSVLSNAETLTMVSQSNEQALIERAFIFLEENNWNRAYEYFEKVLDVNPKNSKAYIGELLATLQITHEVYLNNIGIDLTKYSNFNNALRFATDEYRQTLLTYNSNNLLNIQQYYREQYYQNALNQKMKSFTEKNYLIAASMFSTLHGYKDSDRQKEVCIEYAKKAHKTQMKIFAFLVLMLNAILIVILITNNPS